MLVVRLWIVVKAHLTLCLSGLRGWTQVPLAPAAWVQIPQLSLLVKVTWTRPGSAVHGCPAAKKLPAQAMLASAGPLPRMTLGHAGITSGWPSQCRPAVAKITDTR